jgi:hypothetical protein
VGPLLKADRLRPGVLSHVSIKVHFDLDLESAPAPSDSCEVGPVQIVASKTMQFTVSKVRHDGRRNYLPFPCPLATCPCDPLKTWRADYWETRCPEQLGACLVQPVAVHPQMSVCRPLGLWMATKPCG